MAITVSGAYAAVTNANTLAVNPTAVGDVLVLSVTFTGQNTSVSAVSGGGVATWRQLAAQTSAGGGGTAEIWFGAITATGASTITVTSAGSVSWLVAEQFSCGSSAQWVQDGTYGHNTGNGAAGNFGSLTPAASGELYVGLMSFATDGHVADGSGSGFFHNYSIHGLGVWNGNASAPTAYSPNWTVSAAVDWTMVSGIISAIPVPPAPTLASPGNSTTADLSGTPTFGWVYTGAATQTAWAMRRKIGGGAYSYWSVAAANWASGVPVWNAGAANAVTFPAASWTNGNVYTWSVASQNSTGNGTFAPDFSVTAAAPPTVTITAPTGSATTTSLTATWTDTFGTGGQTAYRVVVYTAAQYGTGGFIPGGGPNAYDSGVVSGSALTQGLPTLTNTTSYRVYVQVTETGGLVSAWAFSAFTITLDTPNTPTVSTVYNGPAADSVSVTVQGADNLLTANQSSLETDTTGWAAQTNCSIARSLSWSVDGGASLRLTSTAAGNMAATTPAGFLGFQVWPNTLYTIMATFATAVSARSVNIGVAWYDLNGILLSTSTSGNVVEPAAPGNVVASAAFTSPALAGWAALIPTVLATGAGAEVHYCDKLGIVPGSTPVWGIGGFGGTATALLQFSDDGVTWASVRNVNALPVPFPAQSVVVTDWEAIPGRQYRATISAGSPVLTSPQSIPAGATFQRQNFWLKDPLNSALNAIIHWQGNQPETKRPETQKVFSPLGRTNRIVVADVIQGEDITLTLMCLTQADWTALQALRATQHTLLLATDTGEQWYVRLGPELTRTTDRARDGVAPIRRYVKIAATVVDAP